ncbi:hypothetical protein GA0061073_0845 [Lactobacillus apis]|uniref:hypothetical protein n=1 Tax=Lactobacillus apis TaxID=303541 RepID=UPI0008156F05|nr:hypothetical protein [Lactobacillus apis]GGG36338.1 hypothetical protein GCM10007323_08000 [Lactobacillus apis]SCB89781.1 hypothetical protein GA0061073_0845 [Lactobacillus apis]
MIINKKDWNNYLNKRELVKIYGKSQDSYIFAVGYMIADLGQYYIFEVVDDVGSLDSYVLYKKTEIEKLVCNDSHTRMFDFYIDYLKKQDEYDRLNLQKVYNDIPHNDIITLLNYCCNYGFYVTIAESEDEYEETVKIISVDTQKVLIDQTEYCKDHNLMDQVRSDPIKITDILTLDIISKENFLYEQYLKQKNS